MAVLNGFQVVVPIQRVIQSSVAAGCFLTAAFAMGCGQRWPSDQNLATLAETHKQEFEALAAMMNGDAGLIEVSAARTLFVGAREESIRPDRLADYRARMARLGVVRMICTENDVSVERDGAKAPPRDVYFIVAERGFPMTILTKGVLYQPRGSIGLQTAVDDLDRYLDETPASKRVEAVRRIDGDWFLFVTPM